MFTTIVTSIDTLVIAIIAAIIILDGGGLVSCFFFVKCFHYACLVTNVCTSLNLSICLSTISLLLLLLLLLLLFFFCKFAITKVALRL